MAVLDYLTSRIRRRGDNVALSAPAQPLLVSPYSGYASHISEDLALTLSVVYRCVVLISTTIAGLPIHTYEEKGGTTKRISRPQDKYLWDQPNAEMTAQNFWETVIGHEVMGDAFLFVIKSKEDDPLQLYYIEPWRVMTGRTKEGQKVYLVDGEVPMIDFAAGGEIIHVPNWSRHSLRGVSPIKLLARAVTLGLTAEDAASRSMGEDASPSGVLSTEQTIEQKDADLIMAAWRQKVYGGNKDVLLSGGVKYQAIMVAPEDLQLLEERGFQLSELGARAFGVPPHLYGDVERSTSWGQGIEAQGQQFLTLTLMQHIKRFEQAINGALLKRGTTGRYVKFELGALLRPALKERYDAYSVGYGKWLTSNDIRRLEDMEPIEGGDTLLAPLNMGPAAVIANPPPPPEPPAQPTEESEAVAAARMLTRASNGNH